MDEISAMAGGAVEGPASKKKKKKADTLIREDDEEMTEAITGAITLRDVRAVMDKLGLTGPDWNVHDMFEKYSMLNNAEELEQVLTQQMTENQADLAWGAANFTPDPVERAPYYSEEDEIDPIKNKAKPGPNTFGA